MPLRNPKTRSRAHKAASIGPDAPQVDELEKAWECRYFMAKPPAAFTHERLLVRFPAASETSDEHDVYLLKQGHDENVKLRFRPGQVKLKTCRQHKPGGFELWVTEFARPLPASAAIWERIASVLDLQSLDALPELGEARQVEQWFRQHRRDVVLVEVHKKRRFYWREGAQLEVATLRVGVMQRHTVQFEARDLTLAEALLQEFASELPETPINYVQACLEMSRA